MCVCPAWRDWNAGRTACTLAYFSAHIQTSSLSSVDVSEGKLRPAAGPGPLERETQTREEHGRPLAKVSAGGASVWDSSWMALRVGGIHRGETLRPERAEDAWGRLSQARNALQYY